VAANVGSLAAKRKPPRLGRRSASGVFVRQQWVDSARSGRSDAVIDWALNAESEECGR
jgi:hypothetical protein